MTINEEQLALLEEYNEWALMKKTRGLDVTPEAFMVERAQATALERLIKVDEYLNSLTEQKDFRVVAIRQIING